MVFYKVNEIFSYSAKANAMALVNKSSNEIPAALACCGIRLSVVNPGIVFISSMCGSPSTKMNSLLEKPFIFNTS